MESQMSGYILGVWPNIDIRGKQKQAGQIQISIKYDAFASQ